MKKHTAYALKILAAAYPSWAGKTTGEQAELWARMLDDLEPEALARASIQYAQNNKFPPTIAELRELARSKEDPVVQAIEAWDRVHGFARRHGRYSDARPNWVDAAAEVACRAVGGLSALREATSDQIGFMRTTFLKVYERQMAGDRAAESRATAERLLGAGGSDNGHPKLLA